ncbi:hypothetical protein NIA71_19700 [Ihubacter massiliensis]|uniref:hypothetical protein n=1 Tax=Ihubacter massiliensis TaxID=1852367 RepID=UPI0011DDE50F|nr:hypothetical protein [Ihubacter massiliensis]MCO7124146.1 hypothetical protein [Ihubacter massiliensis]MDY3013517.1 hypothetical protein [Clostridiales Family XIII bacterium]
MKYKVGDVVRIKDDISKCRFRNSEGKMDKWQGKTVTVTKCNSNGLYDYYFMREDDEAWWWYEDMIAGLVEPELTDTEILKEAITTFGEDEQIRMCHEEMDELGVALSKYHRNPCGDTKVDVQEEIADVCIMMYQAKIMFGEKEVNAIIRKKMKRLAEKLKDEQEVEVVYGKHEIYGKLYTWINPDKHKTETGKIVTADTRHGEKPIIVFTVETHKLKDVKHHKKIVGGVE